MSENTGIFRRKWNYYNRRRLLPATGGGIHSLLVAAIESASELDAPALRQVHVLLAASIESASELSAPTVTEEGINTLLSTDIESASEVSVPTLRQVQVLLVAAIESASEVSVPTLDRTEGTGGSGASLAQLKKESGLKKEARKQIAENKAELAKLFPLGTSKAVRKLALTGKADVGGVTVTAPILIPPQEPDFTLAPVLSKIKDKVVREITRTMRKQAETDYVTAAAKHERDLLTFEERFLVFILLAMID